MNTIAGQTATARGSIARSRRLGLARSHSFAPQAAASCGSIARMTARTVALATTVALTLGGAAFAASEAKAPPAKCKVVSEQTQTQAGSAGVRERTVTTSRCQGKLVTTYTAWS